MATVDKLLEYLKKAMGREATPEERQATEEGRDGWAAMAAKLDKAAGDAGVPGVSYHKARRKYFVAASIDVPGPDVKARHMGSYDDEEEA